MTLAAPLTEDVDSPAPAARVAALRDNGGWRADPVRWRFIESLLARIDGQPPAVAAVLERKLQAALADFPDLQEAAAPVKPRGRAEPPPTPLAELTTRLQAVAAQRHGAEAGAPATDELASARRFRESWETLRTLERLEEALARSPANAGPLNSHALVVKALRRMGDLSVDYLRRFLSHAETLLWLEAARGELPRAGGGKAPQPGRKSSKPARRAR